MKTVARLLSTAFCVSAMLVAAPAIAAPVIDQSDLTNNAYMAGFVQGGLAQSFKPSQSTSAGAGILLQSGIGASDTVNISLWNALPGAAGAQSLASASVVGTQGNWADVFWNAVSVTPGSTYFLVFSGNSTLGITGDLANGYAGGNTFANSGYQSFAKYDYTFREYATSSVAAVPEPATWAMMLVGFGVIGFAMRRRQNVMYRVSAV